jgi:serine/threonine protein kinase
MCSAASPRQRSGAVELFRHASTGAWRKPSARALDQAGIRLSSHARQVGDYRLGRLLMENDAYQDWEATHVSFPKVTCRVRLYPQARRSSVLSRSQRRQAAEHEFLWLQGVNHAGILRAEAFIEHEFGPALIFEHDPEAERLDLFLRQRGEQLDSSTRLTIVRQVAEALQYAHEHRLYHQALSPQTILVKAPASHMPQIKLFDWQTARREGSATGSSHPTGDAGLHLGLFGDAQSLLYMAAEAIAGRAFDASAVDIFALGAVAHYVFSGSAPASSIEELHQKCADGCGLRFSEILDGAGQALQEPIQFSTTPTVEDRLESVRDFLDLLDGVEDEITAPQPEDVVHPLEARVNDRLEHGFVVKKRLGSGSTSIALLV